MMKRWPLRLKIALWSALVVALAQLVSGLTIGAHFYHEDLELVDHLLKRDTGGVFSEIERLPTNMDWAPDHARALLPAAFKHRHVQIRKGGSVVYASDDNGTDLYGDDQLAAGNYNCSETERMRLAVVDNGPWQVRVAIDTHDVRDSIVELIRGILIASPALLLITALGGWWIARSALQPIEAVTVAAREINAARLDQRLPVPPCEDEVQRLTVVLNGMIARLETSFLRARRFTADTSHELRTPLSVIHAGLESFLAGDTLTPEQEQRVLALLDSTTELASLTEKLLLLSRADAGHLELDRTPFDLGAAVREAVEEADIFADTRDVQIERDDLPAELTIDADAARIMQVLRNLLENAVKYNRPAGTVAVNAHQENGIARVSIRNSGIGLDTAEAERVFERFYRAETHRTSSGHGLGLSISQEIARAHGGDLVLVNHETDAIEFHLTLPVEFTPKRETLSVPPSHPERSDSPNNERGSARQTRLNA